LCCASPPLPQTKKIRSPSYHQELPLTVTYKGLCFLFKPLALLVGGAVTFSTVNACRPTCIAVMMYRDVSMPAGLPARVLCWCVGLQAAWCCCCLLLCSFVSVFWSSFLGDFVKFSMW
jgi:hypothetical protein